MNSNGKIQAPVALISDVYKVLGISPKNGVYDVGYACGNSHGQIKIWAKNKPISYPQIEPLTEEQRKSVNYGLIMSVYPSVSELISAARSGGLGCRYNVPTGGANSPYRLTDFDGYDHSASSPFPTGVASTANVTPGITTVDIGVTMPLRAEGDSGISIGDIYIGQDRVYLSDLYFGLVLLKGNDAIVLTHAQKGLSAVLTLDFTPPMPSGLYDAYLFASTVPVLKGEPYQNGYYVGLDKNTASPITFEEAKADYTISVSGYGAGSRENMIISITVTLTSNKPTTFSGIIVNLNRDRAGLERITSVSIPDTPTVDGTWRKTVTATVSNESGVYLVASCSNPNINSGTPVLVRLLQTE